MRRIGYSTLVWLVAAMWLTGCGAIQATAPGGTNISITGNTPKGVAERFLTGWGAGDVQAMYALVSARSREIYPLEMFQGFYEDVGEKVSLDEVTFTLNEVTMQGASAALTYDVTLISNRFGEITNEGRMMRFVREGDQWRVAWSTMDIFEGYTADATLEVSTEPQARANIYDRQGYPLVIENGEMIVLFARQSAMSDVAECERLLADLTLLPLQEMRRRFAANDRETRFYVGEIDPSVEQQYAGQLRNLCGMTRDNADIYTREGRQYMGQGGAVHATGYVGQVPAENSETWLNRGYDLTDIVGLTGIENAYQNQLAGQAERVLRIVEPGGTVLAELGRTTGTPPRPVYLSIDREMQMEAARTVAGAYNYAYNNWAMPDIVEPMGAGTGAMAIDVNTGAILAMVSYPTFQPGLFDPTNTFATNRGALLDGVVSDARRPMMNRVTADPVAPGSVFKIVTTAAAVNEGLVRPEESFYCGLTWDGSEQYGDTSSPRADWRLSDGLEPTGNIVPSQALTSSCDPFFYEFGARLFREQSPNTLARYANMMGLGGITNLNVYTQNASSIPVPPTVDDAINNAIGQGETTTTVLQTAVMVAAVANGGTVYEPQIVKQIGDDENYENVGQPQVAGNLDLSAEALAVVRQGMCDVTTDMEIGTARYVFVDSGYPPAYTVCGKTGTAEAGTYPHAWFVAYAPAENPEVAVVVMSEHSREGSEVAAPMARRILDAYFRQPVMPFPEWWEEDYVPLVAPSSALESAQASQSTAAGGE